MAQAYVDRFRHLYEIPEKDEKQIITIKEIEEMREKSENEKIEMERKEETTIIEKEECKIQYCLKCGTRKQHRRTECALIKHRRTIRRLKNKYKG